MLRIYEQFDYVRLSKRNMFYTRYARKITGKIKIEFICMFARVALNKNIQH